MPTEYYDDATVCPHCKKCVDLEYKGGYMVAPKHCPHCKKPMNDDHKRKVLPPQ